MLLDKIAHIHICGISVRKYYTIINWYDSNIASLLFLETPTIAQKRRREQWLLSMGTINLLLPEYSVNICFIIPNSIWDEPARHFCCCHLRVSGIYGSKKIINNNKLKSENFEFWLTCFLQWIKRIKNSAKIYCVSGE